MNRGFSWLQREEPDKAITDYDEAIRINPKFAEAYLNRGHAHRKKGEHGKAKEDFEEAGRLNSRYAIPN